MAFTWSSVAPGTVVSKAQIQEVKTNIDAVNQKLKITAFAWVGLKDLNTLSTISPGHWLELRQAIDRAHDNNYCREHNGTHNSGVDSGDHGFHDYGEYSYVETGYCTGVYTGAFQTVNHSAKSVDNPFYNGAIEPW